MAFWDDWIKNSIRGDIEELLKADGVGHGVAEGLQAPGTPKLEQGNYSADMLPDQPEQGHDASKQIGRKAIIDDPYFENMSHQINYKHKLSRLSNRTLKEVSVRDWLISSILQCRLDTALRFSRPEHNRHEMGFRFVKRDRKEEYSKEEQDEISALEEFVYHCGRKEGTPADDAMLFGEFLKKIIRDALTFGHVTIEKVKTRAGGLHRLRPLPAENVYLINKKLSRKQIEAEGEMAQKVYGQLFSDNDPRAEREVNEVDIDYYKYVQMSYDNRPLAYWGDEDMIFRNFNPQNFADSNGYCYSPLELAIITITNHMNVENYNANFFTQGYAARGVLHLKGTVTQPQLINFRRQFYNSITGQQNAWRTPIVAGLEEVQWVSMSGSAKEMEYINFNNHLMRVLCTQFQIDPVELGLDYLVSATGRSPMQQANNEYKINYSRERGLIPILMFVEDMINNDVVPAIDPGLAAKYKFVFTGYTDETPQTEIAQMQAEMTVWKSMNDLLIQAQKEKIKEIVGDLPMNQAFWALVEKNYTRGEIREKFFGDKGAAARKELQYIPGDQAFLAWQQMLLAMDQAKDQKAQMAAGQNAEAQQAQLDQRQADQEHGHKEAAHKRDQEKHDMEMEQMKAQAAAGAVHHGNPLKESAQQFGASSATHAGGKTTANPINQLD